MELKDIDFEKLIEEVIKGYDSKQSYQDVSKAIRTILGEESKWRSLGNHFDIQVLSELNNYMKNKYGYGKQMAHASTGFEDFPSWRLAYETGGHKVFQKTIKENERKKSKAEKSKQWTDRHWILADSIKVTIGGVIGGIIGALITLLIQFLFSK